MHVLFTFTKVPTRRICITIKSLGAYNVKQKSGMYNKLGNRMITHFLNWVTTNLGDSQYVPMVDALVSGVQNQLTSLSLTIYFILLNLVQQLLITQTFP